VNNVIFAYCLFALSPSPSKRINAFGVMALSFQLNKAKAPQVSDTTGDDNSTAAHTKKGTYYCLFFEDTKMPLCNAENR
jgi:hypothetical protein